MDPQVSLESQFADDQHEPIILINLLDVDPKDAEDSKAA